MNKKEVVYLKSHFYDMFDRLGENVYYDYMVEYDWNDILENNFNEDNFKIIPIGISNKYDSYFSRYHINKKEWEEVMKEYLLKDTSGIVYECFFENVDPKKAEEYDQLY